MPYLFSRITSFFKSILFVISVTILFPTTLLVPTVATAFNVFSEESGSSWETIVDDSELPDNNKSDVRKRNNSPSRLDEKIRKRQAAQGSQIRTDKNRSVDLFAKKQPDLKTVTYSGHAEADGRPSTLELHFRGNTVSGNLQAKGTSGPGIRIQSTDVSFIAVPLNGAWESDKTSVFAPWTGGDYIDGKLIPDYPQEGNLSIQLAERNGKNVVYLHRISTSQYGYVFPLKGVVYTPPPDTVDTDTPLSGNGYWNPIGSWSGVLEGVLFGEPFSISLKTIFDKTGNITVIATEGPKKSDRLEGKWKRQGNGVLIEWSKATIKKNDFDETSIYAYFNGENSLIIKDSNGVIKLYRDSAASSEKNLPTQTISLRTGNNAVSYGSLGPPAKGYSVPSFPNSIYHGPVEMSWKESRKFYTDPKNSDLYMRASLGSRSGGKVISISKVTLNRAFVTSGLKYEKIGNSLRVTAEKEGQQQVWISYDIDGKIEEEGTGKIVERIGVVNYSWLVLVGIEEKNKWKGEKKSSSSSSGSKPAGKKITITGVAREVGTDNRGVADALVELRPGTYGQECKTDKDGHFDCSFSIASGGRTELFIRKPCGLVCAKLDPIEAVEQDLWPIKKYMLELDPKTMASGLVVTDVVWMDRIKFIPNRYETDIATQIQK